jgi:hypothetical protein
VKGTIYLDGEPIGVATSVTFKLEPTADPIPELRKQCVDTLVHLLGADALRPYEVHVVDTTEAYLADHRTSFVVRVVQRGRSTSLGNMSFNYYHRDFEKLAGIRKRLGKRLQAYCEKLKRRLRTAEQIAASEARKARAAARIPGRVEEESAAAEAAFEEAEKAAGK